MSSVRQVRLYLMSDKLVESKDRRKKVSFMKDCQG